MYGPDAAMTQGHPRSTEDRRTLVTSRYVLAGRAGWSHTDLPSWSCGFDSRRPLPGPARRLEALPSGCGAEGQGRGPRRARHEAPVPCAGGLGDSRSRSCRGRVVREWDLSGHPHRLGGSPVRLHCDFLYGRGPRHHPEQAAPVVRDQEAAEKLTTKADHNSIRIKPTLSEESSVEIPGSRRQPTSWTCLTSEGSPQPDVSVANFAIHVL